MGRRALRVAGIRPADLFPREHGLWAWIGVPLVAAVGLSTTPSVLFGALTIAMGAGASSAWRNRSPGLAIAAGLVSIGLGFGTLATSTSPLPLGIVALILGGIAAGTTLWLGRRQPAGEHRHLAEAAVILVAAAMGAGLAISAGAEPNRAALMLMALATWQITSLWRINRDLARVLKREAWRSGVLLVAICNTATAYLVSSLDRPIVLGLVVLYGIRVTWHAPMDHARDAKRVGLAELGWLLVATAWLLAMPI